MTKKTRYGLIIAAVIIMITVGPVFAQDFETEPDGTGGAIISGYRGSAESVVIPAAIGGKPVTGIGRSIFSYNTGLTTVTIPASVTSIGEAAFLRCTGLTSVTIPASVTSIGGRAFSGCTGLISVTIPASVTSIGGFAFSGCTGLSAATIPAGVTSIGVGVFNRCTGLTAIAVSAENRQYRDIEGVLFTRNGKTLLAYPAGKKTAYQIPAGVTSIGDCAFSGTGLSAVTIPTGVTSIGEEAFYECTGLDKSSRDAIVKRFGDRVF